MRILRYLMAHGAFVCHGAPVFGYLRWLKNTMVWNSEHRSLWKLEKLNRIINFCWNEVPFYQDYWRDHGLIQKRLFSFDELNEFPKVTKKLYKENRLKFLPKTISTIRKIPKSTGGTTGSPIQYYMDIKQWAFVQAFHLWGWQQSGYIFGDPVAVIAGGSLLPKYSNVKSKVRSWIENKMYLSGVSISLEKSLEYYKLIKDHNIQYIYGYPSTIACFVDYLKESNCVIDHIKSIITTAEMLQLQHREKIESYFNCSVFNQLGCNDGGYHSYECKRHNGLHYNDLQSILQVDKQSSTELKPLLITNLWNYSTPFIRYENGDSVEIGNSRCACDLPFPLITKINGRTTDLIKLGNGKVLSGPALTLIFGPMDINGWQIIQKSPLELEIRIISENFISTDFMQRIKDVIHYHTGTEIKINIINAESFIAEKNGKIKLVFADF